MGPDLFLTQMFVFSQSSAELWHYMGQQSSQTVCSALYRVHPHFHCSPAIHLAACVA